MEWEDFAIGAMIGVCILGFVFVGLSVITPEYFVLYKDGYSQCEKDGSINNIEKILFNNISARYIYDNSGMMTYQRIINNDTLEMGSLYYTFNNKELVITCQTIKQNVSEIGKSTPQEKGK